MTDETVSEPMTEMERLETQRERLFSILKESFGEDSDRYIKLKLMYDEYGDRLITAPASSKVHYHNAYDGGYIDHILHVHDNAIQFARVLKKAGGWIDFTKQELVMATIHHDLWKLGLPGGPSYYESETSDWHRKNQGSMYKHNTALPFMKVTDGAEFILQSRGISLTYNEYIGIKLSDGLYEDSNKGYLMNFGKFPIHTNLPYIVHWADHTSTVAERDPLRQEFMASIFEDDVDD
jgi:hypothetical protein